MEFKMIAAAGIILILLLTSIIFIFNNMQTKPYIIINGAKIIIEVAQDQAKGLGGRSELKQDQGMLFIYPDYQARRFWMKDMIFDLDIIWIKDGEIVGIEKNVAAPKPHEEPITVLSPPKVNYVLEVNAGFAEKNSIKINDQISYYPAMK